MHLEPCATTPFRDWLARNGGYIHPSLYFVKDPDGSSVRTSEDINPDTPVLSCPFSLAITAPVANSALQHVLGHMATPSLNELNEQELICTYISLHWVCCEYASSGCSASRESLRALCHLPYLRTLPPEDALRTPLYMTKEELSLISGTNLYFAALDRKSEWERRWTRCRQIVQKGNPVWAERFSWDKYKAAATYLSSRAFPSPLLSPKPSVRDVGNSHPVLLPAIDSLNHRRGEKVSWVVSPLRSQTKISNGKSQEKSLELSLVLNSAHQKGQELFNNYGLKTNAELILGYGFTLEDNPEDTVVFKLGGEGSQGQRHEVGRNASGFEAVCRGFRTAFLNQIPAGEESPDEWEVDLEVSDRLRELVHSMSMRFDVAVRRVAQGSGRPEVLKMFRDYLAGQQAVIQSVSEQVEDMWERAVSAAKANGINFGSDCEDD